MYHLFDLRDPHSTNQRIFAFLRNKGTGMRVIQKDDHPTHHAGKNQKDRCHVRSVGTDELVLWFTSGRNFIVSKKFWMVLRYFLKYTQCVFACVSVWVCACVFLIECLCLCVSSMCMWVCVYVCLFVCLYDFVQLCKSMADCLHGSALRAIIRHVNHFGGGIRT